MIVLRRHMYRVIKMPLKISVDSAGKKAETKLYTGTNTADEDSWSRGMNELSKGYDRYVGS